MSVQEVGEETGVEFWDMSVVDRYLFGVEDVDETLDKADNVLSLLCIEDRGKAGSEELCSKIRSCL